MVGPFPIWEVMNDESMRLNQVEFVPPKPRLHIPLSPEEAAANWLHRCHGVLQVTLLGARRLQVTSDKIRCPRPQQMPAFSATASGYKLYRVSHGGAWLAKLPGLPNLDAQGRDCNKRMMADLPDRP